MDQAALVRWGGVTLIVVLVVLVIRYYRRKPLKLELSEIISLALAVLGFLSSFQLIYQAFTSQELQELLSGNIVVLVIGGVAVIWVSIKEIWKLL